MRGMLRPTVGAALHTGWSGFTGWSGGRVVGRRADPCRGRRSHLGHAAAADSGPVRLRRRQMHWTGLMSAPAPIACTLAGEDYRQRIASITELNRAALRSHQRDGLTLTLVYDQDVEAQVRDLMVKEQLCCAFLRFDLRLEGALVTLAITAPENARVAADTIFDQFIAGENAPVSGCGCC